MYVVTVLFEIIANHAEAFREGVLQNAAASLEGEAGCHRFDVCFSEDGQRCFLYELYTDRAAFEAHMKTAHFIEFNSVTKEIVAAKKLGTFILANPSDQIEHTDPLRAGE